MKNYKKSWIKQTEMKKNYNKKCIYLYIKKNQYFSKSISVKATQKIINMSFIKAINVEDRSLLALNNALLISLSGLCNQYLQFLLYLTTNKKGSY